MIRETVHKVADDLEKMIQRQIPTINSFNILCRKASTVEEVIVIEVMREAYLEMSTHEERLAS